MNLSDCSSKSVISQALPPQLKDIYDQKCSALRRLTARHFELQIKQIEARLNQLQHRSPKTPEQQRARLQRSMSIKASDLKNDPSPSLKPLLQIHAAKLDAYDKEDEIRRVDMDRFVADVKAAVGEFRIESEYRNPHRNIKQLSKSVAPRTDREEDVNELQNLLTVVASLRYDKEQIEKLDAADDEAFLRGQRAVLNFRNETEALFLERKRFIQEEIIKILNSPPPPPRSHMTKRPPIQLKEIEESPNPRKLFIQQESMSRAREIEVDKETRRIQKEIIDKRKQEEREQELVIQQAKYASIRTGRIKKVNALAGKERDAGVKIRAQHFRQFNDEMSSIMQAITTFGAQTE